MHSRIGQLRKSKLFSCGSRGLLLLAMLACVAGLLLAFLFPALQSFGKIDASLRAWYVVAICGLLLSQAGAIGLLLLNAILRVIAEEEIQEKMGEERGFGEQLKTLQEVSNELALIERFDDLCRRAVELAVEKLGFERIGIWFLDKNPEYVIGSFGVDEQGRVRDERGERRETGVDFMVSHLVRADEEPWHRQDNVPLLNHKGVAAGLGTRVVVAIWDGRKIIGDMRVDNLLRGAPITDYQCEILLMFSTALGYLCSRRRAEEEKTVLEEQIWRAQKLESLGVLAGGVAHDFNNILMGILGNADLVQMDLPPDSPLRRNVEQIQNEALRAADLTRQMLAYSGKGKFVIQPLSLSAIVRNMRDLLEVSVSKKATLECRLADNLPLFEGDAAQVRQIVLNLVINASEALHEKEGTVVLTTSLAEAGADFFAGALPQQNLPPGRYVCLEVRDTGGGMDAETQKRIFDPFFSTKFFGRGLGLAAALGIMRGHHGAIKVSSNPGKGSLFQVFFPCKEVAGRVERPAAAIGISAVRSDVPETIALLGVAGAMVLLAEDEKAVREVTRKTLEKEGYEVLTAVDGAQAIEVFERHAARIRLVLLDLTMPHKDGDEVFEAIRKIRNDVPVIVMSGYAEQDITSRFPEGDLAGFLQKPFERPVLLEKMRDALLQQRRR